jgi:hypothetical protein
MNMKSWLLAVLMSISFSLMSQVPQCGGPNQPPCGPGGGVDVDSPITGIEYLIGLGGLLGIKKILDSRKKIRDTK